MKLLMLIPVLLVPLSPGLIDSDSPVLTYDGGWVTGNFTYAIGGTARSGSTGSINFDVYTSGFTMFFLYAPGGADVEVCIDADCVTVSTDDVDSTGRADFTGLESGTKAITLTPLDGNTFHFDAVYIHPDDASASEYQTIQEFTIGEEVYRGVIELRIRADVMMAVIMLTVIATLQVANLVTWLWYRE